MSRDYDDEYNNYEDDQPRGRRNRGGDVIEDGRRMVSGPAIFLIIMGIINIIMIGSGIYNIITFDQQINQYKAKVQANQQLTDAQKQDQIAFVQKFANALRPFLVPLIGIQVITSLVILVGGIKMKSLSSRGFVMTSSILVMVPCVTGCCFIGLAAGIWSLIVLSKPEVKAAFKANSTAPKEVLDDYDDELR